MTWWPWLPKQAQTVTQSDTGKSPGCCEICSGYGMICLNGQRFLCWDHYCQEMQAARALSSHNRGTENG